MRVAILLADIPESDNTRTARALAMAALQQGHDVSIFFNHSGVLSAAPLADLAGQGARLALCAYSARQRGVPPVPGVRWGGQLDWAEAVRDADRVLALA